MPRSRDRHDRGMYGPVVLPDSNNRKTVPLRPLSRVEYFNQCVKQVLATVAEVDLHAPGGMVVGAEDVPLLKTAWSGDRVSMLVAPEPSKGRPAQTVIYQRPLEHHASSHSALRSLVHRTIVEQLSILTGCPVSELLGYESTDREDRDLRGSHGTGVSSKPSRPKHFHGIPPAEPLSSSPRIGGRAPLPSAPAE